jgi:hypothetical protein
MTLRAGAAMRMTVAQLEQALVATTKAHKADAEMAHMVAGMELSERLSEGTLERLDIRLDAGPQVALAMQLLADQSAILDLPASELRATAAPEQAAQLRMFTLACAPRSVICDSPAHSSCCISGAYKADRLCSPWEKSAFLHGGLSRRARKSQHVRSMIHEALIGY